MMLGETADEQPDNAGLQVARWVVRTGSATLMGVGLVVLSGWVTGFEFLKAFTRHNVTMKANTAVGLVLVGLSAWLSFEGSSELRRRVASIAAGVVLFIGAATLSQHILGWNLGIDELLFAELPGEKATSSPGRMGPPASLSLTLAGIALLLTSSTKRRRNGIAQWLGCAVVVIAMLPLMGYIVGAEEFYGVARLTGIAPHTAVALLILGIVIMFLHYDARPISILFARNAGGEMARRVLPAAILLPPFFSMIATLNQQYGWVRLEFARACLLVGMITVFTSLIWLTSSRLANVARAHDRAREDADIVRAKAGRLEAQNLETRNLLETMLKNAPVGFAFFDRELRYVRVNDFLAQMNGVPVEQHLGRSIQEVLPDVVIGVEPVLRKVFETGQAAPGVELVGQTPASPGNQRTWLNSFFPIRDSSGSVAMVGAVVIDITDRNRLEQQTALLLESEQAARVEAERAGTLKDEFLATLSHELRTPLSAIIGWATLLMRKEIEDPDVRNGIETIDRNARVQVQLVSDLLDVSRIISGKLRLEVQSIDLAATIEAAVAVVAPSADAKGVRLRAVIDPQPISLSGDSSRIQQIVWNLLSNAVKFTPKGGVVEVRLRRIDSHAEIVVSDTGMGVKPNFLPHLFERFRQADSTTTRRYGGLGLGLSIVRQLAEMHGGTVSVSSPGENQGTTFVVLLPLSGARDEPDSVRTRSGISSVKPKVDCEKTPLNGVRVLLVDDQPDARALIARLLVDCEATVEQCASADEALVALESFNPTLLISDIGMPGRDGYDLIRHVRQRFDARALPAIALTAFARSEDRRRAMLSGYQIHISKPVDVQELIAAVATLSGRTGLTVN